MNEIEGHRPQAAQPRWPPPRPTSERPRAKLQLARKAVDELYTQMAEEMENLPRAKPLRRKFLLKALEFYEEFSKQKC